VALKINPPNDVVTFQDEDSDDAAEVKPNLIISKVFFVLGLDP
jgi:hypothetical protein